MLKDVQDQLYTQLRINLIKENLEDIRENFTVKFNFSEKMADIFFNDEKSSQNLYIEPIKVSYDKETKQFYFKGKK